MIFLSAQPDSFYFTWQLELQVFNFERLNISPGKIHILLGHDPQLGLEEHFKILIEKLKGKASFFTYPDNRVNHTYASSIRPHIIQQHLQQFPELQQETIFYHDSDIIFRELPEFSKMIEDETWYVSDTRNYLDSKYIKAIGGETLLNEMCAIIGVSPGQVILQDDHCGGAQYVLKNTSIEFWEKLEKDSEDLYRYMNDFNTHRENVKNKKIQSWCADMWALLWNAIHFKKKVQIQPQLGFCWATSPIEEWQKNKILHYTGNVQKGSHTVFRKSNYTEYEPFYDTDLKKILQDNCSAPLVHLINEYLEASKKSKPDFSDVLFVVLHRPDSTQSYEVLATQLNYLEKFLNTNIRIIELESPSLNQKTNDLPAYPLQKIENGIAVLDCIKEICSQHSVNIVALIESDIFLDIYQCIDAVHRIKNEKVEIVVPHNKDLFQVGLHFQSIFGKCLEPGLLNQNTGKFSSYKLNSVHSVFFKRNVFLQAGTEPDAANINDIFHSVYEVNKSGIVHLNTPLFRF
jgi:hypothetical protein